MPRLPDIPLSMWTADQQEQFDRQTTGILEADAFDWQLADMPLPPDTGSQAQLEAEAQRIEDETFRLEQERLAEQRRQEQEAARQYELAQQEQQRQEEMAIAAQQMSQQYGIPTPDDVFSDFGAMEGRPRGYTGDNESSALLGTASTLPIPDPQSVTSLDGFDQYTQRMYNQDFGPTYPDDGIRDSESWESRAGRAVGDAYNSATSTVSSWFDAPRKTIGEVGQQVGEAVQSYQDWKKANEEAGIRSPSLWGDLGTPEAVAEQERIENDPTLGDEEKTAKIRALFEQQNPAVDPNRDKFLQESREAAASAGHAAPRLIGEFIEIATGDPEQKRDISAGLAQRLGMADNITPGAVIANLWNGPRNVFLAAQAADLGASLLESPEATTGVLGVLQGISYGLQKNPKLTLAAVGGIVASVGGAADSLINQRDFVGVEGTDILDLSLEALAAGAAGAGMIVGGKPTAKLAHAAMQSLIKQSGIQEAAVKFDRFLGRLYDEAIIKSMPNPSESPALAQALFDEAPGVQSTVSAARRAMPGPAKLADEKFTVTEANAMLDELEHIDTLTPGTPEFRDAVRQYTTTHKPWDTGIEHDITNGKQYVKEEWTSIETILANTEDGAKRYVVIDPVTGKPIRFFDNSFDAEKYTLDANMQGKFYDWGNVEGKYSFDDAGTNTDWLPPPQTPEEKLAARRKYASGSLQEAVERQTDEAPLTNKFSTDGMRVGGAVGSVTGAVQGFMEDEDAPLEQRIEKAGARAIMGLVSGAAVGNVAAPSAALGLAKAFGKAIESGRMSTDILETHPDANYRVAAMALLLARNKADDAMVPLSKLYATEFVDDEAETLSPLVQRVIELKQSGVKEISAGEIRELADVSNYELKVLGRTAREIVLSYLTDKPRLPTARRHEMGADEAAALGKLRDPNLWRARRPDPIHTIEEDEFERGTRELTWNGPIERENAIFRYIASVASEAGVPMPRVFLKPGNQLNAAAFRGTGDKPILLIEQGFVKAADRLGEDGFKGILMHELSHATDDDMGRGLLLRSKDYAKMLLGKANSLDDEAITAGPERRMQHVLNNPLPNPTAQANAVAGAGMGGLAGAESEDEPTLDRIAAGAVIGGIFGTRPLKQTRGLAVAARSPIRDIFLNPQGTPKLTNKGFFERVGTQISLKWTDSYKQLQQMQDDIAREWQKQTGKLLPAELLTAELKRFSPGSMATVFRDERIKPVLLRFQELEFANADVDAYLMAQQIVDIVESGPMDPKTGTYAWINRQFPRGTTYREAQRYLINFRNDIAQNRGSKVLADFDSATDDLWKVGEDLLAMKRDAGFITDTVFNELRAKYPRYVPFNVLKHITDDKVIPAGRSLSIQGTGLHELTAAGTKSDIMSPLAALLGDVYETHAAVQKNRVFNSFVGLAEAARDITSLFTPGQKLTKGETRVRDYGTLIEPVLPGSDKSETHTKVTGFINGQKESFWVSKDLGDLTKFDTPLHIPMLSGLMDAFKMGATSRNPLFLGANTILDLHSYMVREVARESGTGGWAVVHGINPLTHAKVFGVWARTFGEYLLNPQAWADMMKNEYRGDMKRFMAQGGGNTGYFDKSGKISDNVMDQATGLIRGERAQSVLEKEVTQLQRGMIPVHTLADWLSLIKDIALMKPVERIGERIEMVPRVAAMRLSEGRSAKTIKGFADEYRKTQQAIQAGGPRPPGLRSLREIQEDGLDAMARSTIEGTQAGRTTTIDFAKGGTWAKNLNQIVPFFNVAVQSIADVKRAYTQNPAGYTTALVTGVAAPVYFTEVWNNATESRRKDYEDVPQYIKDQGLVIMYPNEADGFSVPVDDEGNRHPQFLHIRFRHLAPFGVLTREMLQQTLFRTEQMKDMWEKAPGTLFDVVSGFSPIQGTSSEDVAMSFMPPGVSTVLQLSGNRDTFRDRNIVSKNADERATPLSVGMANTVGQATAAAGKGVGFSNEQVEPFKHPSWWEFLTRDVGTGYASMWHGASEIVYGKRGVETLQPQELPVVGGPLSRFQKGAIGEGAAKARENMLSQTSLRTLESNGITWRPSPSDPEIEKARLTRREYADYQTTMNRRINEAIEKATKSPAWADASTPIQKQRVVEVAVDEARKTARAEFYRNLPEEAKSDLPKRVERDVRRGRILP